jgi:hypothetical protein
MKDMVPRFPQVALLNKPLKKRRAQKSARVLAAAFSMIACVLLNVCFVATRMRALGTYRPLFLTK